MAVILVRGTGDVGSAVAYSLYRAGHSVLLHDSPKASHSRRAMAFVNALYEGIAELDGVLAKRARTINDLIKMLRCGRAVPVVEAPIETVVAAVLELPRYTGEKRSSGVTGSVFEVLVSP
jgi:xanthine dehydrogenase accessory factor